ncbi:hypothetical protein X777_14781 [Ooceraea biroi]|uniref:H15 domain-containing protein n=1 Tax=Ooceraea biroi TaxID=2015173 RepID=A0A026WRR0_OOCBI|nr:hypothetical protein X777_14781 [Ooceraea biroi]
MVRRSALVYDFLRTEQLPDGFSQKEIVTHISSKYDIVAGKTLQKDVAVALRRGLDFGILAKKGNKFRRNTETKKRKRNSKKKATGNKSTAAKGQRRQRRRSPTRDRARKQSSSVPRPKLPRPPSWSPKRRYLAEEPIPKVKHDS